MVWSIIIDVFIDGGFSVRDLFREGCTGWIGDVNYRGCDKNKAITDGFYILGICDRGGRNSSIFLPTLKSSESDADYIDVPCLGVMKNGVMMEFATEVELEFVDDVGIANKDGVWYYSNPCYISAKSISRDEFAKYLLTIQSCLNGPDIYGLSILEQIEGATCDPMEIFSSVKIINDFKSNYSADGIKDRYAKKKQLSGNTIVSKAE